MYKDVYTYIYVHTHIHAYTSINTHIHIYEHIHTYLYLWEEIDQIVNNGNSQGVGGDSFIFQCTHVIIQMSIHFQPTKY